MQSTTTLALAASQSTSVFYLRSTEDQAEQALTEGMVHRGYLSASQTQLMTSRDLDLKYSTPEEATFDSCRYFTNLMEEEKKEEEP